MTEVSKTVLLDCDGVLADFTDHLLTRVQLAFRTERLLTSADVDQWDVFGVIERHLGAHAKQYASDVCDDSLESFWHTQPPIEGAQQGVAELRAHGHRVVVVTSPWGGCRTWGYQRTLWLGGLFGIKSTDIVIAQDKHLLRGDVFVDDKASHVEAWAEANKPAGFDSLTPLAQEQLRARAFLFDLPHNHAASLPRWTWKDGIDKLLYDDDPSDHDNG